MKIMILGGDGFSGWPTSLHLSRRGHDVLILDNLSRRRIDDELGVMSLTPIQPLETRLAAWREVSGNTISFQNVDVARHYDRLLEIIREFQPHTIIHFAEQRAAPYSMKSSRHKRYTVDNNINATHNVLTALVESRLDIHLVHLGTMGVYGYGATGGRIPEGYLPISVETDNGTRKNLEILHPAYPGSVYHMTKVLDQMMFQYYNANDGVRITDLHQGIIWGTQTEETAQDVRLINRFDYDGDYGTVLNRFLMQAAIGHPLTVHGSGGQKRAFIHIQDTVRCLELAVSNPPAAGERVRIINQMTETHRVGDLARIVAELTGAEIRQVDNPRKEAASNDLDVSNETLLNLGLAPITLSDGLLREITDIARVYADRCDWSKIPATSRWTTTERRQMTYPRIETSVSRLSQLTSP
ncbi:MAG TPA: NAD-dependent epimerase/dehydratase family protein [Gemmataceae bacterium]|nr:NAD-dependent epimerase/dehydratase family protein [Gemmataceae bacterium]